MCKSAASTVRWRRACSINGQHRSRSLCRIGLSDILEFRHTYSSNHGLITHGAGHARRTTQVATPPAKWLPVSTATTTADACRRRRFTHRRNRWTGPAHSAVIESVEAKPTGPLPAALLEQIREDGTARIIRQFQVPRPGLKNEAERFAIASPFFRSPTPDMSKRTPILKQIRTWDCSVTIRDVMAIDHHHPPPTLAPATLVDGRTPSPQRDRSWRCPLGVSLPGRSPRCDRDTPAGVPIHVGQRIYEAQATRGRGAYAQDCAVHHGTSWRAMPHRRWSAARSPATDWQDDGHSSRLRLQCRRQPGSSQPPAICRHCTSCGRTNTRPAAPS